MYDRSSEEYHLSGIGQLIPCEEQRRGQPAKIPRRDSHFIQPPRDRQTACIGFPRKSDSSLYRLSWDFSTWIVWPYIPETDWRKRTALIHMRCWCLAQHYLGSLAEGNLGLFLMGALNNIRRDNYLEDDTWDESTLKTDGDY